MIDLGALLALTERITIPYLRSDRSLVSYESKAVAEFLVEHRDEVLAALGVTVLPTADERRKMSPAEGDAIRGALREVTGR